MVFGDLQRYWLAALITVALSPALLPVTGSPVKLFPSLCLLALTLAAWILDPLVLTGLFCFNALLSLVTPHWSPFDRAWIPGPLTIWLAVAAVLMVRVELKLRERLFRKGEVLLAERDEQEEWRAFFDSSPAALVTADGEGRIVMANPAARKLLGYEFQPISGIGIAQSMAALGAALRIDRKKTLFQTLTGCTGWRPNGEMFVADAWFSIGETPRGTRLGAVIVDASERLQERARGGLRSSMATSQIAMGAVLHEIRNLSAAAALMYNNLARADAGQSPSLKENADFESLGSLLKTLASLAANELRPGESTYGSVDLAEVLAQLRIIIDPWFQESEMMVHWQIAPNLPHVWGEESGLLQLFLNLAQNSNKAMMSSDKREMTIDVHVEGEWVVARVSDTGPGVSHPEELFEPFRRSTGIKGLGLFVSRAIAHSFHGELKYAPTESGSCFTVELLPLREWEKVRGAGTYEKTKNVQN